ncbi:hypothetical protein IHE51_01710 [Candidatus Parvarchaeota archaeon]|uniref:Prefoldin subunit alpha n=1 Tax=Candidatus Acidifodinimicrobium mancum TaxID=2898728 RepID=A0A8T3URJ1_9ARCH|nr:hypothetical protein [Candidatus Acidifodinimicrobium mancum]MBE5728875.1 hypothetical protein [Candidatus Acidifodinimicrobium mancum]MBE5729850.1 hypothetical protein [Candidatus Acidifodinimicrobium mancum]
MEVDEKALNDRLIEIEYLRRELEESINTLSSLQYAQESTASSLLGLDDIQKGVSKVLIPYSSEIFFNGEIKDTTSPFVNIGSNIFKRMSVDRLKGVLNERLKVLNENIQNLLKGINEMQDRSKKLEDEVSSIYEKYRDSQMK